MLKLVDQKNLNKNFDVPDLTSRFIIMLFLHFIPALEEKYGQQQDRSNTDGRFATNNALPGKKAEGDSGPVHPSWQASQNKKRQYAAQYQGSKITFNSDSEGEDNSSSKKKVEIEENLHPSWQASKMKKMNTIRAFEGKRTKFDSDSD